MMYLAPVMFVFIPILTSLVIFVFKHKYMTYIVFLTQISLVFILAFYIKALETSPEISLLVFGDVNQRFAISFYNDRLSLMFIGITILIMSVVLIYKHKAHPKENLYLFFLMFLEGIFLGVLQTNDLFNMFVFIELIMVLTTILISFKKKGAAFKASIYYLLVNSVGALFFLIGIILIYYVYGTLNIQILIQDITLHSSERLVKLAFVLMMGGISIKAALFPLFFWLPKAHAEARSCTSALLSGLIVKMGLYVFIRIYLQMFLSANYNMSDIFFYIGATSAILGIIYAFSQIDIKLILAYSTVSQIGLIMMGLSTISDYSYIGGLMHIFNHALFKSLLFLGAGIVIKQYQTRNIFEIKGVFRSMPFTSILLIIGMLSITGAPFFNGFVSKSLISSGFEDDFFKMTLFTIINIGTIITMIKFSQILFGPKQIEIKRKNILPISAISILGICCIFIGVLYIPVGTLIFKVDLSFVKVFSFQSWIQYLSYLFIGMITFGFVIRKDIKMLKAIRTHVVTLENANYLFILYLVLLSAFIFLR